MRNTRDDDRLNFYERHSYATDLHPCGDENRPASSASLAAGAACALEPSRDDRPQPRGACEVSRQAPDGGSVQIALWSGCGVIIIYGAAVVVFFIRNGVELAAVVP